MIEFQLEIIRAIQTIRFGLLDTVMKLLTELGDQFAFLGILLTLYWFISKRSAFKLMFALTTSQFVNVVLKSVIAIERPYIKDPSVGVGSPTEGYSFPSGHAQNAGSIATVLHMEFNKVSKWLKWALLALIIIVPLTRVYLGQHYPTDVLAGLLISMVISYLIVKLVDKMGAKEDKYGLIIAPFLVVGLILFSLTLNQVDYEHYKNLFVSLGALAGFFLGYYIDKNYVNYEVKVKGLKILWRTLIGLLMVAFAYVGFSILFDKIAVDNLLLDALRYGLLSIFGTALANFIFKHLGV